MRVLWIDAAVPDPELPPGRAGAGCHHAVAPDARIQQVPLQQSARGDRAGACAKLLCHYGTEKLEGREHLMKPLQLRVGVGVTKGADEQVGVQDVPALDARGHASTDRRERCRSRAGHGAGDELSRNTTRSSAALRVSVAVGVPRMRCAAATLAGPNRQVLGGLWTGPLRRASGHRARPVDCTPVASCNLSRPPFSKSDRCDRGGESFISGNETEVRHEVHSRRRRRCRHDRGLRL